MISSLQSFIGRKISNPRGIFLIDGLGAITSAVFLYILGYFEEVFRIPGNTVNYLIGIAIALACYSFSCYALQVKNWTLFLKLVALANSLYGLFTLSLVCYQYDQLSIASIIYFLMELLVLFILVRLELTIASAENKE